MANNREISQFAGLVTVNDTTNQVSIASTVDVGGELTVDIGSGTDAILALQMGSGGGGTNESRINFANSNGSVLFDAAYDNASAQERFKISSDQAGEAVTVLRNGNVGINSASPATALNIGEGGVLRLGNSSNSRFTSFFNDANFSEWTADVDPLRLRAQHSTAYIRFDTNGSEKMRIYPNDVISTQGTLAVGAGVSVGAGSSETKIRYETGDYSAKPSYREFVASGFLVPVSGTTRTWELFQAVNVPSQYARIAGELLIVCCRHGGAQNRAFVRYGMALNRTGGTFAGTLQQIDNYVSGMTVTVSVDGDYIKMAVLGGNAANNGRIMVMFRGYVEDALSDVRCVFNPDVYVDS